MTLSKPPGDYRVWIDGSYKDGFIGYGIVIVPGYREIYGGEAGESAAQAERLAAKRALESLPHDKHIVIYCDFMPLIVELNTMENRQVTAQYMNDNDPRHRQAHDLANIGRRAASGEKFKPKPVRYRVMR
jgi:hypothetical protein